MGIHTDKKRNCTCPDWRVLFILSVDTTVWRFVLKKTTHAYSLVHRVTLVGSYLEGYMYWSYVGGFRYATTWPDHLGTDPITVTPPLKNVRKERSL